MKQNWKLQTFECQSWKSRNQNKIDCPFKHEHVKRREASKMLKWAIFPKPDEFRKRIVVSTYRVFEKHWSSMLSTHRAFQNLCSERLLLTKIARRTRINGTPCTFLFEHSNSIIMVLFIHNREGIISMYFFYYSTYLFPLDQ